MGTFKKVSCPLCKKQMMLSTWLNMSKNLDAWKLGVVFESHGRSTFKKLSDVNPDSPDGPVIIADIKKRLLIALNEWYQHGMLSFFDIFDGVKGLKDKIGRRLYDFTIDANLDMMKILRSGWSRDVSGGSVIMRPAIRG